MEKLLAGLRVIAAVFFLKRSVQTGLVAARNYFELLVDDLKTIGLRSFVFLLIFKLVAGIGASLDSSTVEGIGWGLSILVALYALVGIFLTIARAGGLVLGASVATEIPGAAIDTPKFSLASAWEFVQRTAGITIPIVIALGLLAALPVHRHPLLVLLLAFPAAVLLLDRVKYGPPARRYLRWLYLPTAALGVLLGIAYIISPATVAGPFYAAKERTKYSVFSERYTKHAEVRAQADKARVQDEVRNVRGLQDDLLDAENALRACISGDVTNVEKMLKRVGAKKCNPTVLRASITEYKRQIAEVKAVGDIGETKKETKDEPAKANSTATPSGSDSLLPPPPPPGGASLPLPPPPPPPTAFAAAADQEQQPSQSAAPAHPAPSAAAASLDPFELLEKNQDLTGVTVTRR